MNKVYYAVSKYERCGLTSCKPCRAVKLLLLLLLASVLHPLAVLPDKPQSRKKALDDTKSKLPKTQQNNNHTASSSSPSSKMAAGATRATRENGIAGRPR